MREVTYPIKRDSKMGRKKKFAKGNWKWKQKMGRKRKQRNRKNTQGNIDRETGKCLKDSKRKGK